MTKLKFKKKFKNTSFKIHSFFKMHSSFKISSFLNLIILMFVLLSCASKPNNVSINKIRKQALLGEYDQALNTLTVEKSFQDKKNKLLLVLNKGSLLHLKHQYLEASIEFQKAITIIEKLYTKKISYKLKTFISNEKADIYYGEKYEHSMVYYYLALEYYLLSNKMKKINPRKVLEFKNKTRATLRAWNIFLDNLRRDRSGETIFKRDLAQHLLGAALHQTLGSRDDLQTALVLYQNAFDVIKKSYNSYPTFNLNWKDYIKDYSILKKLNEEKLNKYIQATIYQNNLKEYILKRLLIVARKIGFKRYKNNKKRFKPSKNLVQYVKEKYKLKTIFLLGENGLIPPKIAQKHFFGVNEVLRDPKASSTAKAVAAIGGVVLAVYASNVLGMMPPANQYGYYDPIRAQAGYDVTKIATNEISIGFELPAIKKDKITRLLSYSKLKYQKNDLKNSENETVLNKFILINPVGDIANEAINEHSSYNYKKLIFRLTTKHLTAILASFALYKAINKKSGKFFAKIAALVQYVAASRIIKNSERADLRLWSLLPKSIQMAAFEILPEPNQNISFEINHAKFIIEQKYLSSKDLSSKNSLLNSSELIYYKSL